MLKRALRELVEREPTFFRDLVLEALRSDGGAAEALLDLLTKHPEARLRLAQAVAGAVAIPLNVATKEDLKQLATKQDLEGFVTREYFDAVIKRLEDKMATKEDLKQYATKQDLEELKKWSEEKFATKEDLKRIENKMATKEQIEALGISVEDSDREMVQYLLEQRGYKYVAERLRLDSDYEFDIYCNAGALMAVGEAKVRAGGRDVEKTLEKNTGAPEEVARKDPRQACGSPLFPRRGALGRPEGEGAQGMAHRKQEGGRVPRGGAGGRRLAGPQRVDGGGAFGGGTAQAGPRPCAHPPCTSM